MQATLLLISSTQAENQNDDAKSILILLSASECLQVQYSILCLMLHFSKGLMLQSGPSSLCLFMVRICVL